MKYCRNCKALIHGGAGKCPLCQNNTTDPPADMQKPADADYADYPAVPLKVPQMHLFLRVLLLCSAAIGIICTVINLILIETGLWCLFVLAGIACVWVNLYLFIRKRKNIIKNITYQMVSATILALLWDLFTGWRGWSIDFVLPIAAACALVLLMVLTPALKIAATDAVLYVGTFIVLSWAAMALWLTGCLHVVFPTLICFGIGLISLAALLIFAGKPIAAEIHRRFHV